MQEKQFTPVGSVTARRVDVRIIAATNVDLRARVAEGRFREDLFHRLNVVRLHVPPLRERKDDIVHLANIFLQQFAALYRRPAHHFTAAAEEALQHHPWPGNVRELQNLVLTSVLFCDAAELDVADLQGFQASAERAGLRAGRDAAGASRHNGRVVATGTSPSMPSEAALRLRKALAAEIAALLASERTSGTDREVAGRGPGADAPTGSRAESRAAEPTCSACPRRPTGVSCATRPAPRGGPTSARLWPAVASALEELIRDRQGQRDTCEWVEACLLAEIESAVPGDARTAAALLGVTEPTLMRRKAECPRHS